MAVVALWLERQPREQVGWDVGWGVWGWGGGVWGCRGFEKTKFIKTGSSGFPLSAQDYGNSNMTGPPVSG